MTDSVLHVLGYFAQFSYPPSIQEVHLFLNKKVSERELYTAINKLLKTKKIYKENNRLALDTKIFKIYHHRYKSSQVLKTAALKYLKIIHYIPTVQYIGISGSLSMNNIREEGDIDIFVITMANSLWLTRFLLLIFKYIVISIQKDVGSKLCFNLFFSEAGLLVSAKKQNEYIGHELLQLKTIIDKKDIYKLLLAKNKWIIQFFPNYMLPNNTSSTFQQHKFVFVIDKLLKKLQVWILKRNGYRWNEYNNQLWLIQKDFEEVALFSSPNKLS